MSDRVEVPVGGQLTIEPLPDGEIDKAATRSLTRKVLSLHGERVE